MTTTDSFRCLVVQMPKAAFVVCSVFRKTTFNIAQLILHVSFEVSFPKATPLNLGFEGSPKKVPVPRF